MCFKRGGEFRKYIKNSEKYSDERKSTNQQAMNMTHRRILN